MKAQNSLYTTIGNISWFRWAAAALAALLVVAAGVSLAFLTFPAAQAPAAPLAAPIVGSPSAPSSKAQSPSDGSAYVEYLTGRAAASSSTVPVVGAGSAYDGGAYGSIPVAPAASYPSVPVVGAGSAYDGGAYGSIPVAPAQPIGLGIDLPAGAELSELPAGLADYIR